MCWTRKYPYADAPSYVNFESANEHDHVQWNSPRWTSLGWERLWVVTLKGRYISW